MPHGNMRSVTTRKSLEADGFLGFVTFEGLANADVDAGPGVYAVLRCSPAPPRFLTVSSAGWFKNKNPSVPLAKLEAAWITDTELLYIGKADASPASPGRGLARRLGNTGSTAAGNRRHIGAAGTSGSSPTAPTC
jgi:hypothetical protein